MFQVVELFADCSVYISYISRRTQVCRSSISKCVNWQRITMVSLFPFTVEPLILATLNFGVWVNVTILDPVILAFLLPTTLKRYCIQNFAARYFRELARLANREIKGTRNKRVLQYWSLWKKIVCQPGNPVLASRPSCDNCKVCTLESRWGWSNLC